MNNSSAPEMPSEEQKVEAYYRDVGALRPRPSPESPAKEQPGEQCPKCGKSDPYWNVSSETPVILYRCGGCGEEWSRLKLEVAAPDVAAMVRRLLEFANRLARNGFSPGIAGDELILREAAALIEKLGKGWIPVRERLPRDDFHVLVHSDWDICDYTAYLRDGKWKHACGDGGPRYEIRSVTHWQPLPPPPERP